MSLEKFQASMMGGAIGDTLGMSVEGWSRDQIRRFIGGVSEPVSSVDIYAKAYENNPNDEENFPHKFTTRVLSKGEYTDDTHLSIATAKALIKGGYSMEGAVIEHLEMYKRLTSDDEQGAWQSFGYSTRTAIQNLLDGVSSEASGVKANSPGNGPTIKMGPVGLFMSATNEYEKGMEYAEKVGRMTHLDSRSIGSGVVQADAIYSLLEGIDRKDFVEQTIIVSKNVEERIGKEERTKLYKKFEWILANMEANDDAAYDAFQPNFAVTRNYPFTLFMFQKYWDSPLEGLLKTVNSGGDADSTGAMFGTLAGAKHGKFYPQEWEDVLLDKEVLISLSSQLFASNSMLS